MCYFYNFCGSIYPLQKAFFILLYFLFQNQIYAQDSLQLLPNNELLLENLLNNTSDNEAIEEDINAISEALEYFLKHPLNINTATTEQLQELRYLSPLQIQAFLKYRQDLGQLIALEELQAVPLFDLETIYKIRPFITINKHIDDYHVPFKTLLYKGKHEIYSRWSRILEQQEGYQSNKYLGSKDKLYLRYRHNYENRLSYGITFEKDAGEEFFKGSNKQGFDFISAHFELKNINAWLKNFVLGDFSIRMGQGLIFNSGFSTSKGAYVTNIKRGGRPLSAFKSVNEANYLRGVASTILLKNKFEVTTFLSYRGRDANLSFIDSLNPENNTISAFQTSGLHRTSAEIEDKNAIKALTVGNILKYKHQYGHIATNLFFERFNTPLQRNIQAYNQFQFNGQQSLNISLDYSFIYQNFNFFGETAMSQNKGLASTNGLLISLDRRIDLALLYRHFQRNFQTLYSNTFGETSSPSNEYGFYAGLDIKPNYHWTISLYGDIWRHPWLRFGVDAPSTGFEYLSKITYRRKRKMEVYLQFRTEHKQVNVPNNELQTDFLVQRQRTQLRFHLANKLTKSLELRNRLEFSRYKVGDSPTEFGYMAYQDVIFKPLGLPVSFTGRFAIFNTSSYNTRIYTYENNVLYNASILAYYNRGTRFYFNIRYKIKKWTLEARIAQTYWANQDFIGSALEATNRPTKTEIKTQVRFIF